jgi:hypothetical protein
VEPTAETLLSPERCRKTINSPEHPLPGCSGVCTLVSAIKALSTIFSGAVCHPETLKTLISLHFRNPPPGNKLLASRHQSMG